MNKTFTNIKCCRVCKSDSLLQIHNFNEVPLADKLTQKSSDQVPSANLSVVFCKDCTHLQVFENVSPILLFQEDYPYFSSRIPEVVSHFREYCKSVLQEYLVQENDLIVEIASNDGVLLNQFKSVSNRLLGIEPSLAPAIKAIENKIPTLTKFFSKELAVEILAEQGVYPKLIMANNVLAHVPDPISFVKGLKILSNSKTTIIVEVPHSLPMLQAATFDVIFHQHFSYFNLKGLKYLFEQEGLFINKVEKVATQGGSLRLHINIEKKVKDNFIIEILKEEEEFGLYEVDTYINFSKRIDSLRSDLCDLLKNLKSQESKIVGYGAPGKAATLLNYFDINNELLDYLVDVSSTKHQKYFPFTGLKIYNIDELDKNLPDYILILAWNYTSSILNNLAYLKAKNVKFILMYPELKIID